MSIVKIELIIDSFPKLKKEYEALVNQGYKISKYRLDTCLEDDISSDRLEIVLEDSKEVRILISQDKFHFLGGKFSEITKINLSFKSNVIHPNIKLNKECIQKKEFKKKLMGGYDCNEVDGFLDIIVEDYQYFEERNAETLGDNDKQK